MSSCGETEWSLNQCCIGHQPGRDLEVGGSANLLIESVLPLVSSQWINNYPVTSSVNNGLLDAPGFAARRYSGSAGWSAAGGTCSGPIGGSNKTKWPKWNSYGDTSTYPR